MTRKSKPRTPYATIIALVIVVVYYLTGQNSNQTVQLNDAAPLSVEATQFTAGAMVESFGVVERTLPDDNEGSRHQRFILSLASGQTLLVAHNIDLAPRIEGVKVGDTVKFRGQFETNNRGGVIHWTHHDPRGEHPAGWLEHDGRRYQ